MAGSVSSYKTQSGQRYMVRYRKPDGRQTTKRGFATKRDARLYLSSIDVDKAKGVYIDPTEGKRTVAYFGERWKRGHNATLKPSSRNTMETAWRVHVEPYWGSRQVAKIRRSEVSSWIGALSAGNKEDNKKPLAAQTVRRIIFVLSLVLDIAVEDGAIPKNPARGLKLPAKTKKPTVYLTHQQVELLATKSTEPDMIRFLAYTGLRWGEMAALRVKHLDFKKLRMRIESNVVLVKGELEFGTPKTGEPRAVPMLDFITFSLTRITKGKPRDAFVFGKADNVPPLRPHAEYSWFANAVKAAMKEDSTFPRVTPHDLRHTAASLAVSSGANPKAVQRMLGHASAAMTMDVYADLFDQDIDDVAANMSAARNAALSNTASKAS